MNSLNIFVILYYMAFGGDPVKPKTGDPIKEQNPKALSVTCYNSHPKANVNTNIPIKTNLYSGMVIKIAGQPDMLISSPIDVTNTGNLFTFANPWGKRQVVDISTSLETTNTAVKLYNYLETCQTTPTVGAAGDATAANQLILNTRIESAIDTLKNIQDTLSAIYQRQARLASASDKRQADSLGVLIALSRSTANRPSSTWESDSLFIKATNDSLGIVIQKLGDGIGGSDSLFIKATNDSLGLVIEKLDKLKRLDSLVSIRNLLLDLKNDQISSIDTLSLIKNSSDTVVARLTEMLEQGLGGSDSIFIKRNTDTLLTLRNVLQDSLGRVIELLETNVAGSDSNFIKANTDTLLTVRNVLQDSLALVISHLKDAKESLDTLEKYIKPTLNAFGPKGVLVDTIKINNYLVDMDSLIYLSVENLGTVEATIVWNGVIVPLGGLTNGKGLPTIRYYEARYDQRSRQYVPLGTIRLNASGTKLLISATKHQ